MKFLVLLLTTVCLVGCTESFTSNLSLLPSGEETDPKQDEKLDYTTSYFDNFDFSNRISNLDSVFYENQLVQLGFENTEPTLSSTFDHVVYSDPSPALGSQISTMAPQDEGTLQFWVKGQFTGTGQSSVVDSWASGKNQFYIRTYSLGGTGKNIQVAFQAAASPSYLFAYNFNIPDQEWHFISITWNSVLGSAAIYMDGVLLSSGSWTDKTWRPSHQQLKIGSGISAEFRNLRLLNVYSDLNRMRAEFNSKYKSIGSLTTESLKPVRFLGWGDVTLDVDRPPKSSLLTQVEFYDRQSEEWSLVPDQDLNQNSKGFTTDTFSIRSLRKNKYPQIRLRISLKSHDHVYTPKLKSWRITWAPEKLERPRVHLTPTKLAQLREGVSQRKEPLYSKWVGLKKAADEYLKSTPPIYPTDPYFSHINVENRIRMFGNNMPFLCLTYLISNEEKYKTGCKRWMMAIVSYEKWGSNEDLGAGHLLYGLAIGYDWLYNELTPEERSQIEAKLLYHQKIFYNLMVRPNFYWWTNSYSQNHNFVNVAGLATAALAIYENTENSDTYAQLAYSNFTQVLLNIRTDGSCEEGVSYWSYGMEALLRYFEVEESLYQNSRGKDSERIKNNIFYRLHTSLPDFKTHLMYGDAKPYDYYGPEFILEKLSTYANSPMARMLAKKISSEKRRLAASEEAYQKGIEWRDFLWLNQDLEPAVSNDQPTYYLFPDLGMFIARSAWDDPMATVFSFKAGPPMGHSALPTTGSGHAHPDAGHFTYHHAGKSWLIDDGYSYLKLTNAHNLVTFDGVGQIGEGQMWFDNSGKPFAEIIHADNNLLQSYHYYIADLKKSYPSGSGVTQYLRHYLFIHNKNLLIFDQITTSTNKTAQFYLHFDKNTNLNLAANTNTATFVGLNEALFIENLSLHPVTDRTFTESHTGTALGTNEGYEFNTYEATATGTSFEFLYSIRPFDQTGSGLVPYSAEKNSNILTIKAGGTDKVIIHLTTRTIQIL